MIALGLNLYTEAASAKFNLEADEVVAKWLCVGLSGLGVGGFEGWELGVGGWELGTEVG